MNIKRMVAALLLAAPGLSGAAHADTVLAPFEPGSLERIEAAHKGKPFVLILWSLDCPFCQGSMTVLAQEKRTRAGMTVVTLATEQLGDPDTDALVRARLGTVGLTRNAWAYGAGAPEQLRYAVDPKWHGELPRSYWYDARGKRVAHSGALTPAMIARFMPR